MQASGKKGMYSIQGHGERKRNCILRIERWEKGVTFEQRECRSEKSLDFVKEKEKGWKMFNAVVKHINNNMDRGF